jgi:Zn-dependent protease
MILIYSKIAGIDFTSIFTNNLDIMNMFRVNFTFLNITLAAFNLIPIPPLDGFRLVKIFWRKAGEQIEKYTLYISMIFLFLLI